MKQPEQEPDRPEDVRGIAALDDGEATPQTRLEAERQSGEEGVEVFDDE